MRTLNHLPLLVVGLLLATAPTIDAQQMRGGGGPGGLMALLDPVEAALEHKEALELSSEHVALFEAYHAASIERTKEAREIVAPLVEQMRERMSQAQGQQGQAQGQRGGMQGQRGGMQGQRGGMGQGGMGQMDERTQGAIQTLRAEFEANRTELAKHLTQAQTQKLQELMRPAPRRPGGR